MTTNAFYENVPIIYRLSEITDDSKYRDIPADWYVAVTDIRNSTQAIEEGRYRDVNSIAAASIAAMLNAADADLPFVFSGDGAILVTPPEFVDKVKVAMLGTQRLSSEYFGLYLRSALIPVREVIAAGHALRVTRMQVSENFIQAIFNGGGISFAEQIIKDPNLYRIYSTRDVGGNYDVDFSGFECRWEQIPATMGETISLLVKATADDFQQRIDIYRDVLTEMDNIFGDREMRHPINPDTLKLATKLGHYYTETVIKHKHTSFFRRLYKMLVTILFGQFMKLNIGEWGSYKSFLVAATDNEKFDDTIRMIISGSPEKRAKLTKYLEGRRQVGDLVYGVHTSSHTLMTCIVYDHFGRQMHFVDGADGGYVQAAKQMKAQLQAAAA